LQMDWDLIDTRFAKDENKPACLEEDFNAVSPHPHPFLCVIASLIQFVCIREGPHLGDGTRDWVVDGRVNKIYIYVFPAMIALQAWATYLERANPSWWQAATQAILG
jgi:hypothetical protein